MSSLLKAGSAALDSRVRPFAAEPAAADPPRPDPELAALRSALAEAEAGLAERDELIAGIPALIEAAGAEREERGRASVEDAQAERLALLAGTCQGALERHGEAMAALDRLAALLAATCLERMLLADGARAATVADLLRGQMARLEADAVVRVQVSAEDFPDGDALAGLIEAPCEIIASQSLDPGACTIQLRLGTLEVGLDRQWGTLRSALEEMAA